MNELLNWRKNITIPNFLSVFRIIIIIPFIFSFIKDNYILAGFCLVFSGLSDLLDGVIARGFNQITDLGKMLDPAADKLTLMAVMICVGIKFKRIFPFMIILIIKEILMLVAGLIIINRNQLPPPAKWYGKVATTVFYVSIITIVALKALWNIDNGYVNLIFMVITAVCMIYALARYFKTFILIIKSDVCEKKSN